MQKQFTITKRIAKHGKQNVIVIPSFLKDELKPRTVVELKINIIKEAEDDKADL
ncbi:hypothetical protein J4413_01640 [Candidatus Woesearchaeota archaeon]|nr:hypothetical protein [Candidatus Woesearchaeota archaeon]